MGVGIIVIIVVVIVAIIRGLIQSKMEQNPEGELFFP
jgi:hypothetical protein